MPETRFVIDLNVMITAWSDVNPCNAPDYNASLLLLQIINKCRNLVVTKEIEKERYYKLFDRLKSESRQGPTGLNVISLYFQAKQSGKIDDSRSSYDLPPLPDETHIKDEDREFVRLANLARAVLITFDDPLIKKLRALEVKALDPQEACKLVDP